MKYSYHIRNGASPALGVSTRERNLPDGPRGKGRGPKDWARKYLEKENKALLDLARKAGGKD